MLITYDDAKRLTNIAKHNLDFRSLDIGFFEDATIFETTGNRLLAVGKHQDGITIAVVFRLLGTEALSVISMRPASRKERASS